MLNLKDKDRRGETIHESPAFVFQAQSAVKDIGGGMKRQLLGFNNEIMAVRVSFEEGAIGELHKHPHSQVAYVASGVFDVTIGQETKTLTAGDSFYVEPHVMHGAICKEAGVLIDMFSPIREDFLAEEDEGYSS